MDTSATALQHVNVKFFIEHADSVDLDEVIQVFHRWIQDQKLDDLLIDVADYRLVPSGPGILLIGHNAQYSFDNSGDRLGVLFNQKSTVDGSPQEVIFNAIETARKVCRLLAQDDWKKSRISFLGTELQITVNDRLLAPNTEETLERLKPSILAALNQSLGTKDCTLERATDPRARFSLLVKFAQEFQI
ncbi:MAG TPA: hypothetical protein EYQ50_00560 [Verrucomicrobiales bacterium]|jgi:hypothetical protein|nr:hypothetical protein [Verrucomicrobiales bacterium]HIL68757.1 hypothetical protein [Verrucomicrobiota bacterium]